jgi:glycosyltransferase involved in cell wall biosynthesis
MPSCSLVLDSKVMLLTKQLEISPKGGRELLCKLNHDALKEIYGERLVLFELPRRPLQGIRSVLSAFKGNIDGLDESTIAAALQIIQRDNVGKVFVDGSNLGGFVNAVKARLPQVEISTFFHNIEARFFWGSLRERKSLHAIAVLIVNYLAERKSVRHSDKIICLSERDSRLLRKVYGRSATHVSAMALQDKMQADFAPCATRPPEKFALFVGGVFYANRAGIAWFVEHVAPLIKIKICIVGRGFEKLKSELERDGKVEVVGAVDSLSEWYANAQFVIAPIFDGSGMKTKVAEALMHGKKVVGTPEAFSGYEDIANRAGWICITANDFVSAISSAQLAVTPSFDCELRAIYKEKYSFDAARSRLAQILQ